MIISDGIEGAWAREAADCRAASGWRVSKRADAYGVMWRQDMSFNDPIMKKCQRIIVLGLCSVVALSVVWACAGDAPKGPPPTTADQVRGHADRAFEKLKQEEQERAAQPPVSR